MKVRVDGELCTGDGICVDLAPEVFELNEDNIAIVLVEKVEDDQVDAVKDAVESCPETCIFIDE